MVTTVVAAEVVLLGVEVQAVVVGVILVLVPKVVVLVVVAVAPGLCLPGIPDWHSRLASLEAGSPERGREPEI